MSTIVTYHSSSFKTLDEAPSPITDAESAPDVDAGIRTATSQLIEVERNT